MTRRDPQSNPDLVLTQSIAQTLPHLKGDLDYDADSDIFDILRLVDILLNRPPPPSDVELWAGDMDDDGDQDIFDIIALVDKTLEL